MPAVYQLDDGESLRIGASVVRFEGKSGRRARLVVEAAPGTPIEKVSVEPLKMAGATGGADDAIPLVMNDRRAGRSTG